MTGILVGYALGTSPASGRHDDGGSPPDPEATGAAAGDAAGVRVERMRADDPHRTRLEARILGAGPHVEPVLDVGTAPNGDLVLVLPPLPVRLPELLAIPGWPSAGEAVTVLVPLLQAVEALHAAGVAHGDIRPAAVRLDERGAAVLCGFEHAVLRRTGSAAFEAAAQADRAAAARLAQGVLRAAGVSSDAPAARSAEEPDPQPAALIDALFALTDPEPVRWAPRAVDAPPVEGGWWQADGAAADGSAPGRIGVIGPGSDEGGVQPRRRLRRLTTLLRSRSTTTAPPLPPPTTTAASTATPTPTSTATPTATPRPRVADLASILAAPGAASTRRGLGAVRARVWAAAAVAVLLLVLALVLLPGRGADAIDRPSARASAGAGTGSGVGASIAGPPPTPSASPGGEPGAVAPRVLPPVRAATALLARRATCLAGTTPTCLAAIDAAGSPVETADRAAMAAGVVGVLPEGGAPRLLGAAADSATLDVHGCAVLVVREPAGWRLRDVVAEPHA